MQSQATPNSASPFRVPIISDDGETVMVPIHGSDEPAVIDRDDFDRLMSIGITSQWCFTGAPGYRYVRCRSPYHPTGVATVSRLILEPASGEVIRYKDRDAHNLRRSNLYVDFGHFWSSSMSPEQRRANLLRRLKASGN